LVTLLFDEFGDTFLDELRKRTVPVYLDLFTPEELADIRAFLETPAGKSYIAQTPNLMAAGAANGEEIGAIAFQNSRSRIAQRLQEENILVEKQGTIDKLIEAFR